ncbi:MAG: hypothetical protein MI923_19695 [Phycisphaerales bacterium]|nr:hypothetical protein [Phycisphaerales bacterium]
MNQFRVRHESTKLARASPSTVIFLRTPRLFVRRLPFFHAMSGQCGSDGLVIGSPLTISSIYKKTSYSKKTPPNSRLAQDLYILFVNRRDGRDGC